MKKKNILKFIVIILDILLIALLAFKYTPIEGNKLLLSMDVVSHGSDSDAISLYYCVDGTNIFDDEHVLVDQLSSKGNNECNFILPNNTTSIRMGLGNQITEVNVSNITLKYGDTDISPTIDQQKEYIDIVGVESISFGDNTFSATTNSKQSYINWSFDTWKVHEKIAPMINKINVIAKSIICVFIGLISLLIIRKFDAFVEFPVKIFKNRRLLLQLSRNDFKTKFAGSYLGTFWAFIQPIITVMVYWFVFQVGLRSGGVSDVPFVLWLIAGLVPWFFFSEALNGGTNALIEYQYLVKKVVFEIDILPMVKVLSSLFTHLFFVGFTLVLYTCYGYFPNVYTLQILYYSFCCFVFVLSLSYITSAIVCFFKDLTQIINIILQVGIWMTPIMWNIDAMGIPTIVQIIFKLNPLYYITAGYRDALINHIFFWQRTGLTLYFWTLTILLFGLGTLIFKRLKVHFADVL